MFRKNIFLSFINFSLIIVCLSLTDYSYAQSRAAVKRSGKKTAREANSSKRANLEKAERVIKAHAKSAALKIKKQFNEKLVAIPLQYHGVSDSLFNLASRPDSNLRLKERTFKENERELFSGKANPNELVAAPPSAVQTETSAPLAATPVASFEGPGQGMPGYTVTISPPDTTLAVGLNHVVVWVNAQYAVFSKSGTKLLPGNGFVDGNTLFAGLGNACETTNRGDPTLQYDRLADRWILSQFAFSSNSGPFLQCIAVSTSGDPTGSYYRYSFSLPGGGFNDYGKLGVWTDAYYISYAVLTSPAGVYIGSGLCAYDKAKMMIGEPAVSICGVGNYAGADVFLPIDLDGTTLPTNTNQGGIFAGYSFTGQAIRLIKLKPDFANLTGTLSDGLGGALESYVNIPVGATTAACNGVGSACAAQPGTTTKLDTLGDRLMYRLAYRNRNGVDSLLVSHAVDPDGEGARGSAIRWYEIRNPFSAAPTLYQNATYDPGANGDRWMSSLAMDKFGNILMGYNVANAATNLKPSIAFTGRLQSDPLNTMQGEIISQTGGGSQIGGLTRWGDYTTMQIDPADDATFWYIGQYLAADDFFNWNTRVFSYKFVTNVANVEGNVTYGTPLVTYPAKYVPNVSFTLSGDSSTTALTNNFGAYSLTNLFTGGHYTVTPAKTGNVNGISPFDATLVLRHVAANGVGPNALSANQQIAADTNGAGGITAFDATLILRYVAANSQNANTGLVGNWKFLPGSQSYQPLNGSAFNQNYTAILIGEINGNWVP
ncbi:MAG TPA: dockerin type I repeat-containing protein [Pyrinomonadaceae bacterium]